MPPIIISLAAAAGLMIAAPAYAATGSMTLADLLVKCYGEESGPERNFCLGYLLGFWDALPTEDACVRPGTLISAGMLREMLLTGVGPLSPNQPAKDISAGVAAWTVMRHYFPCPRQAH